MAIIVQESFTDTNGTALDDRVGEFGAVWTKVSGSVDDTIESNRLQHSNPGYVTAVITTASGVPGTDEYDVEFIYRRGTDYCQDGANGVVFRYQSGTGYCYILRYETYTAFRRWNLIKVDSGGSTSLDTYSHSPSANTDYAIKIEVRNSAKKVFIDASEVISVSDNDITDAGLVGIISSGINDQPTYIDSLLVTDLTAGGPEYFCSPTSASGPPELESSNFTLTLASGVNPGSVVITPAVASGGTGTFSPTSVTLTDAARSAVFTFTPDSIAVTTIEFTNDESLTEFDDVTYTSEYAEVEMLSEWESEMSFGSGYPWNDAIWLDGHDHYDAPRVFQNIRDYTGSSAWDTQIGVATAYLQEFLFATAGINGYHNYNTGLARQYERTGDTLAREAAIVCSKFSSFSLLSNMTSQELSRETAFSIISHMESERLGREHLSVLEDQVELAKGHIAQWTDDPPGSRTSCVFVRPFMVALTCEALIRYYDIYRDSEIPPLIKAVIDWIWDNCWQEAELSFGYTDIETSSLDPGCGGYNTGGTGAVPDLNLLISPIYAWYYRYTVLNSARDNLYRQRHDKIFNGSSAALQVILSQKVYNQSYRFSIEGLKWRDQGDSPWSLATDISMSAIETSGRVNALSERFVVELSGTDVATDGTVTVTPSDSAAGGSFFPTTLVLTTDQPKGAFRYRPASSGTKTISITNDGGLGNPASIDYTASGTATIATAITLSGPSVSIVDQYSDTFTAGLSPASNGAVPSACDEDGGLLFLEHSGMTSGGATGSIKINDYALVSSATRFWVTTDNPEWYFRYSADDIGAHTINLTNFVGLDDPEVELEVVTEVVHRSGLLLRRGS